MKKFIIAMVALLTMTVTTTSAMSYEQARQQALFLTDKMAYELNLTNEQYEAAYEVNLDYLMGIDTYDDLYGTYWRQRNLDLSYILLDWQYRTYVNASYFYRPLYWDGGYWHFGIYARYPRRDYFFFGCPTFYTVYRGGHSWHMNGGRSWYHGRDFGGPRDGGRRFGMRDGFNRGDFGRGQSFGNMSRQSSTRTTVTRDRFNRQGSGSNQSFGNMSRNNNGGNFGNNRNTNPGNTHSTPSFGNGTRNNSSFGNRGGSSVGSGSFGNRGGASIGSGSFGNRGGASVGSGSFGNRGGANVGSGSFGNRGGANVGGGSFGNRGGGSFGGGNRGGGGSFGHR